MAVCDERRSFLALVYATDSCSGDWGEAGDDQASARLALGLLSVGELGWMTMGDAGAMGIRRVTGATSVGCSVEPMGGSVSASEDRDKKLEMSALLI